MCLCVCMSAADGFNAFVETGNCFDAATASRLRKYINSSDTYTHIHPYIPRLVSFLLHLIVCLFLFLHGNMLLAGNSMDPKEAYRSFRGRYIAHYIHTHTHTHTHTSHHTVATQHLSSFTVWLVLWVGIFCVIELNPVVYRVVYVAVLLMLMSWWWRSDPSVEPMLRKKGLLQWPTELLSSPNTPNFNSIHTLNVIPRLVFYISNLSHSEHFWITDVVNEFVNWCCEWQRKNPQRKELAQESSVTKK